MKENEFEKGIEELKKIKLSDAEKRGILKTVFNTPIISPYAPQISFWSGLAGRNKIYVRAAVLILFVGGSITAYSAENSLPGDTLYPIKINLTEPARDIFNIQPVQKAEWEGAKAVRRLDEAADLAIQGKLNENNRSELESRFNEHSDAFDVSVSAVAASSSRAELIRIEFKENISAKARVLEDLSRKPELDNDNSISPTDSIEPVETELKTTEETNTVSSNASDISQGNKVNNNNRDNSRELKNKKEETKNNNRRELDKLKNAVYQKLKNMKDREETKDF